MFETVDTNTQDVSQSGLAQPEADILNLLGQKSEAEADSGATHRQDSDDGATQGEDSRATREQATKEQPEQGEAVNYFEVPDDAVLRVPFQGEMLEVTGAEYKQGFQRYQDYTKGKQELSQRSQQLHQELQAASEARKSYLELLQTQEAQLKALIPDEPNWVELAKHPEQYEQTKAAWNAIQTQLTNVQAEREKASKEQQQTYAQQMQAYLADQQQQLLTVHSDLADPEKAKAWFGELNEYAVHNYGYQPHEIAGLVDHRALLILEKAKLYDALQAKGEGKQPKIPTLKPGASQGGSGQKGSKLNKERARFNKTGSVQDAETLIEAML